MEHKYLVPILVSKMTWVIDLISLVECPGSQARLFLAHSCYNFAADSRPKKVFSMEICAYALTVGRVLQSFQRRKRKKAGSSTRLFGRALTLANIVVVAMLTWA